MRAGLAPVVVGVDEVDAEALESPECFDRPLVARGAGADLGVVERDGRELDARAVEVEVAAVDPELAEAEPDGEAGVQRLAGRDERDGRLAGVARRVDVPECLRLPRLG